MTLRLNVGAHSQANLKKRQRATQMGPGSNRGAFFMYLRIHGGALH